MLGISLGSRSIGIALMRNGKLVDWQVKSFTDAMNEQKLHFIAGSLMKVVREHGVASVVLKLPLAYEVHINIVTLKKHLLKAFNAKDITVECCTLRDIKTALSKTVCNKQELATCMVALYPELRFVYLQEQKARNCYYLKLFEAVAALHIHIHRT